MKNIVIFIPSIESGGVEKNLFYIINHIQYKFKRVFLVSVDKFKDNAKVHIHLGDSRTKLLQILDLKLRQDYTTEFLFNFIDFELPVMKGMREFFQKGGK